MKPSIGLVSFVPQSPHYQATLGSFEWSVHGPLPASPALQAAEALGAIRLQRAPFQDGELHWSEDGCWVVLALDADDTLTSARVLFMGAPRAAYQYMRDEGFPLPGTLEVRTASPWEEATAGPGAIALGAAHTQLTVGEDGLAFAAGVGGCATAGDGGLAISRFAAVYAGHAGHALTIHGTGATAGDHGVAMAGEFAEAAAGQGGLAIVGTGGTARVGTLGTSIGRGSGHAEAGDLGRALAGEGARATAGVEGLAWTGKEGQACVGDRGVALVGAGGSAQAGEGGVVVFLWWDNGRCRATVAHVGEAGIRPDVPYRLGPDGALVPVDRESPPSG